jgi:glycosyltransferase involved in cell wall biosynthesis
LFFFLLKIFQIKKKYNLIHLNDTNLIIIAPILKFFFKSKIICHVRTRVKKNKIPSFVNFISKNYIDKYICIDKSTFSTSPNKKKSIIIYNVFQSAKLNKKKSNKKKFFCVGFLGSLDFHKGLDFYFDCISDININKNNFLFLIGGSLSIKNQLLVKLLDIFKVKKNFNKIFLNFYNKKYKNVKFLNNITNLDKFYQKIDLICFPSRMNALGRPVIEAASYGIPSIVCLDQYFNDTIIDKKTGYVLKFGEKKSFIKKLYNLSINKKKLIELGINAKKNYNIKHNIKKNTKKLNTIYKSLL